MKNLNNWWRAHYNDGVPVAHILRHQIPDRWLRIHSLPESKRYPETAQEYAIMLARHNAVAEEILGVEQSCLLFVGRYGEPNATDADDYDLPTVAGADFNLFDSVEEPDEYDWDGDEPLLHIWHAPIVWTPNCFDNLLAAVADERKALILFENLQTGEAYLPY